MVTRRRQCLGQKADGQPCQAAPLTASEYCWVHDPANAEAATEARRLGGLRRRREGTLAGAYEFDGLTSVAQIRRLIEIAVLDVLGLENSVGRARTLLAAAREATQLLELGEVEERLRQLEQAVQHQRAAEPSPFHATLIDPPFPAEEHVP